MGAAAGGGARGPRPEFGSDLVLRNLADASERTFGDVVEFSFPEDGKQLVYAVSARDTSKNGVFAARIGGSDAPVALLAGKGKYLKLTWDENQTQLAFLSDRDDSGAKTPKFKLYRWDRQAGAAAELASVETAGFRKEFVISDKGTLSFSKDGTRVFFACATPAPEKKEDRRPAGREGHRGPVVLQRRLHPADSESARRARPRPHVYRRVPDPREEGGATGRWQPGDRHAVGEFAVGPGHRRPRVPAPRRLTTSATPTPT